MNPPRDRNPSILLRANERICHEVINVARHQPLFFYSNWELAWEPTQFILERQGGAVEEATNTQLQYGYVLGGLFRWCTSSRLFWRDLVYADILAYRRSLIEQAYAPRSINQHLAAIRTYYGWAQLNGIVEKSPFPLKSHRWERNQLKLREPEIPPRAIPISHLRKILSALSETNRLAAKIALSTGMRANEIANLGQAQLPVTLGREAFAYIRVRRKGSHVKSVAIPVRLLDEIHRYIDFGERATRAERNGNASFSPVTKNYVLIGPTGRPLTRISLSKAFNRAAKSAGFSGKRYSFHGLRHTFAITMLRQLQNTHDAEVKAGRTGFNVLLVLRNLMGHAQLSTTEIYLTSLALDESEVSDSLVALYASLIAPT